MNEIKEMLDLVGGDVQVYIEEITVNSKRQRDAVGTYTLWVNVNGICRLRDTRIGFQQLELVIPDRLKKLEHP